MKLRNQAEKRLKDKKGTQKTFSRGDFDEVVHELYVHQIELEMQNESLMEAQSEVAQSRDEYLQLFNKAPVGYVNLNVDGYIDKVNDTFAQMLNRPKVDVINRSFVEFMVPEDSDLFHVHLVESRKKNSFGDIEIRFKRVDGSFISGVVHGEIATAPDNETVLYRMAIIDNSEAKKLREELIQAHKMQAVGLLAGGISHEINNMLSVVMGYTELAQEEVTENTVVKEDLNQALSAAGRIKTLVQQLLTFSRKSDRNIATLNLSQAIREAFKVQENTIPVSILIKQDIQSDCLNVFADQVEINQIVLNLFSNSIHAMRENGTIQLALESVTLKETDSSKPQNLVAGDYAIFSFCDTGEGMDEATRQQIFDPFFTTKSVGEGTGMGLSIIHGIMENYQGAITVDSCVDKGTTFKLYFPISQEVEADISDKISEPVPTGTECILYVDDEKQIAEIGRRILEGLGYSVVSLTSGTDALNCFFADPDKFDLVISDQIMPDISGLELLQKIHLHRKHLPVILCTGYSTQVDENTAKLMGISFIMKPFVLHELAQLVRKVLDTKI